jgi:hypothetical protein
MSIVPLVGGSSEYGSVKSQFFWIHRTNHFTLLYYASKENELIDFVIDKTLDDFSLERFREQYLYYCRDLCDVTEDGFREYLSTFFHDKGMPVLAATLNEGSKTKILHDVVRDLKMALKPALYDELIENSFHYAPPYLPLFKFMMQFKKWPLFSLSVMDVRINFGDYAESIILVGNILESVKKTLT